VFFFSVGNVKHGTVCKYIITQSYEQVKAHSLWMTCIHCLVHGMAINGV